MNSESKEAEQANEQMLPAAVIDAAYLLGRLIGEGIIVARRVAGAARELRPPGRFSRGDE